jgi:hypothetical protein
MDLFGSSIGGVLSPDSILNTVPRADGVTIKGKHGNIIILKNRDDDDDIGKHFWAMPQCLQMCVATNASNASMHVSHKHSHKCIYHLLKTFNYILFI